MDDIRQSKSDQTDSKSQANSSDEHVLVIKCMAELCKKAGFSESQTLVQRDFEFLSETIESKTGVLISLSTIKRLLNGQFSRLPQIATLNAISTFIGYKHWQDYKSKNQAHPHTFTDILANKPGPEITQPQSTNKPFRTKVLLVISLLALGMLLLVGMLKVYKIDPSDLKNVQFSAQKTTVSDLPNTVIFNYNVDDIDADSFFIQQSWDKKRRVKIFKKNYTITDIYYTPGYHTAKLIANDQIIKTVDVSIPTDGWFFYAKAKFTADRPKYISTPLSKKKNEYLHLDKDDVVNNQIDIGAEQYYCQVNFPSNIKYSSDNYVLKLQIKVNNIANISCPYFMCEVFCQRNFTFFTSTLLGCSSEVQLQFGENYLTGKTHDLSALTCDVTEWQNIEIKVMDKKVSIYRNGLMVFSRAYTTSSGLITGLGFISNGLCEVKSLDFKTMRDEDILQPEMTASSKF